mmetsp:Transcript_26870/g.32715  ORF Transcript_26870/g.32715 Transcript_26870/m.32715 type:complete len:215 (-) Transcript_26870:119-763(-)
MADEDRKENININDIKKAPPKSGYMLFASEMRANPDNIKGTIAEQSKLISMKWNELNDDNKNIYKQKCIQLNNEYKKYLDNNPEIKELLNKKKLNKINKNKATLPLNRIKKIYERDPDIKRVSKESQLLMQQATEMFIHALADSCSKETINNGRKTISGKDFINAIHQDRKYLFLRHVFPKNEPLSSTNSSPKSRKNKSKESSPKNSIKNFFNK